MVREPAKKMVAVDAAVLINFIKAERLDLLGFLKDWEFFAPDHVIEEVAYPEQATALEQAIRSGHIRRESGTDMEEIALYSELRQRMGKGEAGPALTPAGPFSTLISLPGRRDGAVLLLANREKNGNEHARSHRHP